MALDLNDMWGWLQRLIRRVERLESGAALENSSITNGRMRFIGGQLLIDSGGTLQIIGALDGEGNFRWVGPWEFDSPEGGRIAGDVELAGDFDLTGVFTSGNVRIEDGKIYVGTGTNLIVIDGATGKVTIGSMVLDPSNHNGMVTMPNDSQVLGSGSNLELFSAGPVRNGLSLSPSGLNIATLPVAESLTNLEWVARGPTGVLYRVPQGMGGPGGGPLDWPFPASLVTSEFGPRDGGFHEGIDFGTGIAGVEGAPIPAAAAGTVVAAVTLHSGWGNYVKLSHGNGLETLYAHMVNPPTLTVGQNVARGQTLGGIGNTGNSFGNHLHFEVHENGVAVNPRSKLPAP